MGRALAFAWRALLADVQGTLSGEGLREGSAAVALVVVVDVVAEQAARTLWGGRRERYRVEGGKEGREEERGWKQTKHGQIKQEKKRKNGEMGRGGRVRSKRD